MVDNEPGNPTHAVRAIRGVFWSGVNSIIPSLVGFLVFLVTSRYLGPAEFGVVALAGSLVALLAVLLPTGFAEAIVQRSSVDDIHLDSTFWVASICALVAYALLAVCSGLFSRMLGSEWIAVLLPVAGLRLFADAAGIVPQAIITRRMSFKLIAGRTLLATVVSAALTVLLLVAGYGVWALLIAQLSSSVTAAVAAMWGAGWRPKLRISLDALTSLARYGAFSSGTRAMQALTTQADPAIVGLFLGPHQAGIYAFSRNLFQMILNVLATPIGAVAHPMFSAIQENVDRVKKGYLLATFLSSALSFPVFIGFAMVADLAVPVIFGSRWVDTVEPIRLYCGLGTMACIGVIQGSLINSRGHAHWWFYYQLAAGIVTLAILLLMSRFGVTALLAAVLIATIARWPFAVIKTSRLLAEPVSEYLQVFVGPVGSCIVMVVCIVAIRHLLPELPPVIALGINVAVGAVSYLGAMLVIAREQTMDVAKLLAGSIRFQPPGQRRVVSKPG
ncbi:lipopolysaccharide biosynthesis protein [Bradyrhizobium sp. Ash2021]|uniref:lipopolysaccharide biosynthesis protein n=1 Tax=Bradyrhizobium sp. Ash2021 TaxID=2954771 RepID=UPI0028158E86|nr:lipopolysaccharide biosynthesis protein [Bradyrhizobium sp. Ash2021]WMT72893.1 lipopolysaccharide biosynthesis protein [Bradyrhizobium sp. Ash2021]